MGSVIVSGRDEAQSAIQRLADGDVGAWILVLDANDTAVTAGATLAPTGSRPLASYVRASLPGLQATLARTLAGVVLSDGDWRAAMEIALANPDLTVMTHTGDRFGGGRPWRFGGDHTAGVTAPRSTKPSRPPSEQSARAMLHAARWTQPECS